MSKRKTYDEEFKKNLVNLILNGQSLKEISHEYGVSSYDLILWRKKYSNINTQSDEVVTRDKFKKLQKELAAAKEECAIL
ncbi:MAG: transposase, partial [Bacilli bacterium]